MSNEGLFRRKTLCFTAEERTPLVELMKPMVREDAYVGLPRLIDGLA